jgi:hypothetical protein
MRRNIFPVFVAIISIFLFVSCLKPVFAQANSKKFVEIEITKKKEIFFHKAEVPFTKNPFGVDGKTIIVEEVYVGGFATVDCLDCPLSREYGIFSYAKRLNENSSELSISIDFRKKRSCSVKDVRFTIQRGKLEKFNLKCGVKLTAYYE